MWNISFLSLRSGIQQQICGWKGVERGWTRELVSYRTVDYIVITCCILLAMFQPRYLRATHWLNDHVTCNLTSCLASGFLERGWVSDVWHHLRVSVKPARHDHIWERLTSAHVWRWMAAGWWRHVSSSHFFLFTKYVCVWERNILFPIIYPHFLRQWFAFIVRYSTFPEQSQRCRSNSRPQPIVTSWNIRCVGIVYHMFWLIYVCLN